MELRDKIAGALYGMALGDAMGMPAELWGRERARKFFGGKITEFIDDTKRELMLHLTTTKLSLQMIRGRQWFFWIH